MSTETRNVALCVFNAFSSYTAITLNTVTIYAMTNVSLPKPLKTLLLSLAVSDLGVGLTVQPLHIAILLMKLEPNRTFTAFLVLLYLLSYASFLGVTALTLDRFLAIHLHLRYNELVTHKRVVAVVILIWIFSAILSSIRLLVPGRNDAYVIFATIEIFCLITTAVLYCKIYLAVRHHTNQIHTLQVQQEAQNGEMAKAARLRKSAVATFYVYLVFLVCYLPRICSMIFVATRSKGSSTAINIWFPYTYTLVFINSSLNPLIYCWKMSHVRLAIMDILRKILAQLRHNSKSRSSDSNVI